MGSLLPACAREGSRAQFPARETRVEGSRCVQSRALWSLFAFLGLEGSCSCDRRATFLLTPNPPSDKQVSPPSKIIPFQEWSLRMLNPGKFPCAVLSILVLLIASSASASTVTSPFHLPSRDAQAIARHPVHTQIH